MKRHPALIPLSHDHHHGLVQARRLRRAAAAGDAERREAAAEYLGFFAHDTIPHFRDEEERIFPLLADAPEPATELVTQALLEHQQLHALVGTLADESAGGDVPPATMERIAQALEDHIRFEERTLFPLIEGAVPGQALLGAEGTPARRFDAVERTTEWQVPTLADVLEARRRISPHLPLTPLYGYAALNELLDAEVFVKHENHQPVGAFKVRGGINLIAQLSPEERERGVIAASTGNHGQSIAYAARLFGVRATICVPQNANPVKVAGMRALGAELVFHGRDYDEAREHCEQLAQEHGARYVHSGNEPLLIAGVATETLEILEQQPETEVIIVPIGGGSAAAGACIVAQAVNPDVRVIGVQSEAAPAAYRSWQERRLVDDRMQTFAEGLATRTAFELPQRILWQWLDDFVLVSDDEIRAAQALMIEATRNLVEAAGAAPLAAAIRLRGQLASKRTALIASGGNATREQLLDVLGGERSLKPEALRETVPKSS